MEAKLKIKNLTKMYSEHDGVKNVNLDVKEHELLTLLGPSGCGKTSILRAIGGFNTIDSGKIILNGKEIQDIPTEKRPTGMVFQSYNLWPHMTVFENVSYGLKLRKVSKKDIKKEVSDILEVIGMAGSEKKFPAQLSGGQQQRIAIARSLVLKPEILLLDEPFSALDAKIRQNMRDELKRIQKEQNLTIVFVTHDQEEAMALSDRIAVMNKGKIEQVSVPVEIYDKPKTKFVANFIGEMNFLTDNGREIGVRPEDVIITPANEGGNAKHVIKSITSLGYFNKIIVAPKTTNSKDTIQVYSSKEKSSNLHIGTHVDIEFKNIIKFEEE